MWRNLQVADDAPTGGVAREVRHRVETQDGPSGTSRSAGGDVDARAGEVAVVGDRQLEDELGARARRRRIELRGNP